MYRREALLVLAGPVFRAVPGLPNPALYPPVPMAKIAKKEGWVRPRALIAGKVTLVRHEDDDDWHFKVEDAMGRFVVCEEIPELRMPNGHPKIGDLVQAWGIVRWDAEHLWSELHPVIGWKLQ